MVGICCCYASNIPTRLQPSKDEYPPGWGPSKNDGSFCLHTTAIKCGRYHIYEPITISETENIVPGNEIPQCDAHIQGQISMVDCMEGCTVQKPPKGLKCQGDSPFCQRYPSCTGSGTPQCVCTLKGISSVFRIRSYGFTFSCPNVNFHNKTMCRVVDHGRIRTGYTSYSNVTRFAFIKSGVNLIVTPSPPVSVGFIKVTSPDWIETQYIEKGSATFTIPRSVRDKGALLSVRMNADGREVQDTHSIQSFERCEYVDDMTITQLAFNVDCIYRTQSRTYAMITSIVIMLVLIILFHVGTLIYMSGTVGRKVLYIIFYPILQIMYLLWFLLTWPIVYAGSYLARKTKSKNVPGFSEKGKTSNKFFSSRSLKVSHLGVMIQSLSFFLLITIGVGCRNGQLISVSLTSCVRDGKVETCETSVETTLTLPSLLSQSCYTLVDEGGIVAGRIQVTYSGLECGWDLSEMYYTASFTSETAYNHRCGKATGGACAGGCDPIGGSNPLYWNPRDQIPDSAMGKFGYSACHTSECGICDGCALHIRNCVWYRWFLNADKQFYVRRPALGTCVPKIRFEFFEDADTPVITHETDWPEGETIELSSMFKGQLVGRFAGVEVSWGSLAVVHELGSSNAYLVEASAPNAPVSGSVGDIQYPKVNDVFSNFQSVAYDSSAIKCALTSNTASCSVPETGTRLLTSDNKFPLRHGNLDLEMTSDFGRMRTFPTSGSPVQLLVSSLGKFTVTRTVNSVCPRGNFVTADGYYSSLKGCTAIISAWSECEEGIVSVSTSDPSISIWTTSIRLGSVASEFRIAFGTAKADNQFVLNLKYSEDQQVSILIKLVALQDPSVDAPQVNTTTNEDVDVDTDGTLGNPPFCFVFCNFNVLGTVISILLLVLATLILVYSIYRFIVYMSSRGSTKKVG